jgi:hypothetical protein
VLDASALVALFGGHPRLERLLIEAEAGAWNLILPTTCIADAERVLEAGTSGWEAILLTSGVLPLPLSAHTAIEIGQWPGSLSARHAAHEQAALRAVVVTCDVSAYAGLPVALLAV